MAVETRGSLFTKLGIFGCIAIACTIVGKRHIAATKDKRHRLETDARTDSEGNEFDYQVTKPGVPESSSKYVRESKYQGSGVSYSSRRPGDRLSMFAVFDKGYEPPKD